MNEYLFRLINDLYGKNAVLDFIGIVFAEYIIFVLGAAFFIYLFIKKFGLKDYFFVFGLSFVAWLLSQLIKLLNIFSRPLNPESSSFPSGHTSVAFTLAFSFFFFIYQKNKSFLNKIIVVVIVIVAFLIGIARILTGKHWPFDIFGGAVLGFIIPYLIYQYKEKSAP